ncbi:hypothetical protein B0H14DRAFT_3503459 [Mycena olivaceomarginata]|nr:hypothetical protein B0H14DRAFT_3503459 [Mycena olivaceomarginata]
MPSAFPRTADPFNADLPPGFLEDWAELQAIQAAARDDTPDAAYPREAYTQHTLPLEPTYNTSQGPATFLIATVRLA